MSGDAARKMSLSTWNKRKDLVLWVMQWATENQDKHPHGAFDIIELAQLLQCAGFHLQKFELSTNWQPSSKISLQLTCGRSGMTATMSTTPFLPCNCSPSKEMEALVLNKKLDPLKQAMTVDVLKELIFIFSQTDGNENEKENGHTWEVDPNTTPPRDSSSPMPNNNNKDTIVKENVKKILTIASSTLDLLTESRTENITFTKDSNKALKRVSDIKPAPTLTLPETPCASKKPATPVPGSNYKNVSSKVDTFRQKCSPSMNAGKPVGVAKRPEKSKIPSTMLPRFGSKRGEHLSVKEPIKK